MRGLIFVHGTSQDRTSLNELTVRMAAVARGQSYLTIDIGGPGSTERSVLRMLEFDPEAASPSSFEELSVPLDYAMFVATGTATGRGIDGIVEDVIAKARMMLESGVTRIDIVGFSRGAVAAAMALERIDRILLAPPRIEVNACLLDPVPGPILVPKLIRLPPWLRRCGVFSSVHESRPGFNILGLVIPPEVELTSVSVIGVHGDIGGSTRSKVHRLVADRVAEFLDLPGFSLDSLARVELIVDAMEDPSPYVLPALPQGVISRPYARRSLAWGAHDEPLVPLSGDDDFLAQALAQELRRREEERERTRLMAERLERMRFQAMADEADRQRREMMRRFEMMRRIPRDLPDPAERLAALFRRQAERENPRLEWRVPQAAVRRAEGQLAFRPPDRRPVAEGFGKGLMQLIRKLPK